MAPGDLRDVATRMGPMALWRAWHPNHHTATALESRTFGPVARFDPHPAGPPADHPDGPGVWYASLLFDTAVCERLARDPRQRPVVDVCPGMRGTLVELADSLDIHDLTNDATCARLDVPPDLGDGMHPDGYHRTQQWARHLHASGSDGLRYRSARHRRPDGSPHGINVAVWNPSRLTRIVAQHRLVDDTLWPHVLIALDAVDVTPSLVSRCPICPAG